MKITKKEYLFEKEDVVALYESERMKHYYEVFNQCRLLFGNDLNRYFPWIMENFIKDVQDGLLTDFDFQELMKIVDKFNQERIVKDYNT